MELYCSKGAIRLLIPGTFRLLKVHYAFYFARNGPVYNDHRALAWSNLNGEFLFDDQRVRR